MSESDAIVLHRLDTPASSSEGGDGEAEPEIERLEAEIALKRERVVASFRELRRRVHSATDWRQWVRAHPVAWIAAAVTVGFVLGTRGGRRG